MAGGELLPAKQKGWKIQACNRFHLVLPFFFLLIFSARSPLICACYLICKMARFNLRERESQVEREFTQVKR